MSAFQGEWWIDDHGQSLYADGDVGDIGHEAYAYCTALGLPLPGDNDSSYEGPDFVAGDMLSQDPEDEDELLLYLWEQGADEDAIEFFTSRPGKKRVDAREFMIQKHNWIRAASGNFQMGLLNADALRRIRNFDGWEEEMEDDEDDPITVTIEDQEGWYEVPVRVLLDSKVTPERIKSQYGPESAGRFRSNPNYGNNEYEIYEGYVVTIKDALGDQVGYLTTRSSGNPVVYPSKKEADAARKRIIERERGTVIHIVRDIDTGEWNIP